MLQVQALPNTVPNSAGGHDFAIDDYARLDRFLILGSEGGSYYAGEHVLTRENAADVLRAIRADGARVVEISTGGRAPKNDPALFALALAAPAQDLATRRAALAALLKFAWTGTHLFPVRRVRAGHKRLGAGAAAGRGQLVSGAQPVDRLAYQLVKYRRPGGWTHRDLLRLDDAVRAVSGLPFDRTDCARPMLYALERGIPVDAFVVCTDSETWAGSIHPVRALRQYRERTGIAAKLVVVSMVSNGFSIVDPSDAGTLDVVGFDTATPAVIVDFIRQH